MSKQGRPDSPAAAPNDLPFEQALERLNSIVEAMESDDLPLEKMLTSYEDGMKMYHVCQERLATAELKVQQIEKDAAGRLLAKPLPIPDNKPEI